MRSLRLLVHGGLRALLVGGAVFASASAVAAAAPETATVVGASPRVVARLHAVVVRAAHPARVAVPTFVPAGYRLATVTTPTIPRTAGPFEGDLYSVQYRKDARSFFEIDCTSGGIGSVDDVHERDVRSGLFARPVQLYFSDVDARGAAHRLISEWSGKGPFYHVIAENMTPDDVARVVRSLTWLR